MTLSDPFAPFAPSALLVQEDPIFLLEGERIALWDELVRLEQDNALLSATERLFLLRAPCLSTFVVSAISVSSSFPSVTTMSQKSSLMQSR